ncbi:MAG: anthranilate phosphoribosyltransferase [Thermoguttaceae bacterium]|nr:anthranilate phosphoribosyltransferase [Thermoguttaceae bacterium]
MDYQAPVDIFWAIQQAESGRHFSMEQMAALIGLIMEGWVGEEEMARLLTALHRKGETSAEVAGAAQAMRRYMSAIRHRYSVLVDVVGTGGDGSGTFNISTAAALVTAAAGVPVAKHGNRRATSRSGSADVLAALGVDIEADLARVEKCLDELGICFCFAPLCHRSMQYVAPVRRRLPHPTIFNLLGPLTNPAGASYQLIGVGRAELRPVLAEAAALLGTGRTLVVHGADGLDEVSLAGPTWVSEIIGHTHQQEYQWTASDFGLRPVSREELQAASPAQSAQIIRQILAGQPGGPRDVVLANVAAALWCAGVVSNLPEGVQRAAQAIDTGKAQQLLNQLIQRTHAGPSGT